jgi:CheY-like chemotaxis protein
MVQAREADPVRRVLVVDDDAEIRQVLTQCLELDGYHVSLACNGQEALEFLKAGPVPDMILLDLMMPVMDGRHFRVEQRKDPALAAIPTVILSAEPQTRHWALLMGAAGYLEKPVGLESLLATVAQHAASTSVPSIV